MLSFVSFASFSCSCLRILLGRQFVPKRVRVRLSMPRIGSRSPFRLPNKDYIFRDSRHAPGIMCTCPYTWRALCRERCQLCANALAMNGCRAYCRTALLLCPGPRVLVHNDSYWSISKLGLVKYHLILKHRMNGLGPPRPLLLYLSWLMPCVINREFPLGNGGNSQYPNTEYHAVSRRATNTSGQHLLRETAHRE